MTTKRTARHATPRQPLSPVVYALLMTAGALVLAVLFSGTAQATPAPVESWSADTCEAVDANALSDSELAEVFHLGYMGSPSDGTDQLYPPHCLPADAQLTDQDDATGCMYITVPSITMDEQLDLIADGWDVDVYEDGSAHAFDPDCYPLFV